MTSALFLTSVQMGAPVLLLEVLVSLSVPVQWGTPERGVRTWWTTVSAVSVSMEENASML